MPAEVSNIDSDRMVLRIERGEGGVDSEVPLNPKLLTTLRARSLAVALTNANKGHAAVRTVAL
jgi:hypothetical protein